MQGRAGGVWSITTLEGAGWRVVRRVRRAGASSLLAVLASVALAIESLALTAAGEPGDVASPVVGGFGVGDGLEGTIDERVGAFRFTVPVGGLKLAWDSRTGD